MDSTIFGILWVLGFIILVLICTLIYFIFVLSAKEETIQAMQATHIQLMRSFNDLDEQAKIIVRTDIELNKIRAEMDVRLNGLNAIQRASRQISQALNKNEIFQKIPLPLFENLGFAHVLIACADDNGLLKTRLTLNYPPTSIPSILNTITQEETLSTMSNAVSSLHCPLKLKKQIQSLFNIEHFILAPLFTQNGNIGFVFTGNPYTAQAITQADEELITILAGQIGQSVDNAELFEKVFLSRQELELKVAERTKELANALQSVNEINKKKSEFISAVSHELRTPLTSIKGYAAILIAGKIGLVPDAVKERLAKINAHSDSLVGLVNNLLDIARIESGRQEMKFSTYAIKHIIDNITDLLTPQISAKNIRLQVTLDPSIDTVYMDASQAERVFINLLSNAIKFTPTDGTITIAMAPASNSGYALFSVTDTGIGIPPSEIHKLFSEFFRVDNEINQNVKGTGLGLVLAKNIVEAHHGTITVTSQVKIGTTFSFTLPITQNVFEQTLHPLGKTHA